MEVVFVVFDETFKESTYQWLQNETLRTLIDAPAITKEQQEAWFAALPQRTDYKIWGIVADQQPIGVCGLKNITTTQAEYWGYIGNTTYWGKGIGKEMMRFVETQATQLHLSSLYLKVLQSNERAIRLYEKAGFQAAPSTDAYVHMSKALS